MPLSWTRSSLYSSRRTWCASKRRMSGASNNYASMSESDRDMPETPFLTAQWRYLAMLNYAVDPALLAPFAPRGTELDSFAGHYYISLVGFRFLKTRLRGVRIP